MLKLVLAIILAFPLGLQTRSLARAKSVNLGGIQVDMSFCEAYDKWSGIMSSYSNVIMPVGGAPGVTMGTMMNTSLIVDFCSYMTQMASLDMQGKIRATAELGNKMSDNQFTEEMDYVSSLWDLGNQAYDFQSGKGRKAAITSSSFHRNMATMIKRTGKKLGYKMENRREQERSMGNLARIAYQRSIIKSASTCPKPTDSADYGALYNKEIVPLQDANEVLKEYLDFYREALLSMGVKIMTPEKYDEYVKDLENVLYRSSSYNYTFVTKNEKTTVLKEKKEAKVKATDSKTESVQEDLATKYQKFGSPRTNPKFRSTFITKYDSLWQYWVKNQALMETKGLLNSPRKKVEDEFKDFSILCNRGKYSQQFDRADPMYNDRVEEAIARCKKESTQVISSAGGLMSYYVNSMVEKDSQFKRNQGTIWTFESEHLGNVVNIAERQDEDVLDSFTQPEVQCAPIKNIAVMAQLQLKQEAVNAELNQEIVAQIMKQNAIMEEQARKKEQEEQEAQRREKIREEVERRKRNVGDDMVKPDMSKIEF